MPGDPSGPSPHQEHRRLAPRRLVAWVLTVSDSRTEETDISGRLMAELMGDAGHEVRRREVVPDDPALIRRSLAAAALDGGIDVILINGGTGLSPRDQTYETVRKLLERDLPGFGEIFRHLSFLDIGPAAMASRALAGVYRGRLLFCTPGSPAAVRLAMEKLIIPEAPHLAGQLGRGSAAP